MSKLTIDLGDPQPLDCPKCGDKYGYFISDYIKIHYNAFYTEAGEQNGGDYSESQKIINEGKRAYCMECSALLPFKINR